MRKRTKIAASAGAALAIAGAGAAVAADRLTPSSESEAVLNDAAAQLGVEPAKLTDALKQALKNRVDDLVEDGVLTDEQGDAIKERIESTEVPLLTAPFFAAPHAFKLGPGRGFGPGLLFDHARELLDQASSYLGLTESELLEKVRDGNSLAEIAKQQGKTADGLVDALVAAEKKQLDAAVKDGTLTDAQRDRIESKLEERVTDVVNAELPAFGRGFGFKFGRGAFLPSRGTHLDAAASYLGVSESELRADLREGESLADVAKEQGKSVDGLVDALVADEKKELDDAVQDGRLTDAQRDRIESTLEQRVTDFVNGERPFFGPNRIRPGSFPGGRLPLPFPDPEERPADA
jgi:hypothetical protein